VKHVGAAAAVSLGLIGALAGCASPGSGIQSGEHVTVYVSMPLRGPDSGDGHDVVDGAKLALADAQGRVGALGVNAVYLDDTAGAGARTRWDPATTARNARRVAEDSTAIAYLGDFASGATRFSVPITNQARMLQVSPASGAVDLVQPYLGAGDQVPKNVQPSSERTFGRVIPSDEVQGEAGAVWAKRLGSRRPLVSAGESAYDKLIASAFSEQARALGLHVANADRSTVISDLLFAAIEGNELKPRAGLLRAIPRVMGTDALLALASRGGLPSLGTNLMVTSAAQDPSQLPAAGQRFVRDFRRRYHRSPGRYAAYGYEAMAVVLDSIERAGDGGDDREAVVDSFFETSDRNSILGSYSIDEVGNTTLDRLAGYRVVNGRPVFDTPLAAP